MPETEIPLFDLLFSLSDTIDLVSPRVANHHMEVAYIALELAKEYGLSARQQGEIMTAGMLHDVGALSLAQKLANLEFEVRDPHHHAELSWLLLRTFAPFSGSAALARFHHVPWNGGNGAVFRGEKVPLGSHILHLADRVAVLRDRKTYVLDQTDRIKEKIKGEAGRMFMPDLADAFLRISEKQYFWLNISSPRIELPISQGVEMPAMSLGLDDLLSLAKLFAHIIDFRSKYTATHSAGVGEVARTLAELAGFPETESRRMEIAGYLHDLGKLAVPVEILDKPGKLTKEEFNVIFSHPFYTRRALQRIKELDVITRWASFHHERLNGGGYPYHHPAAELPPGARIMAVADVFTAILEERPYQKDMTVENAAAIIRGLAANSELDPGIVGLLMGSLDKVNSARANRQAEAAREYREFYLNGNLGHAEEPPRVLAGSAGRD